MIVVVTSALAPSDARALDASAWDRVLAVHARDGGVDYGALAADAEAMRDLQRFLGAVAEMPEDEPLASWLNAYDALVVASVLEHYPIGSVREVPGFFDRERHRVARRMRTLDDIENRVIRPRFHDARVHVALNCGARSCPPLYGRAFRQETLDTTLDRLARAFVTSERYVRVQHGTLTLSQIFEWFADDFRRDAGGVTGWIRRYGGRRARSVADTLHVAYLPYDWRLNDR